MSEREVIEHCRELYYDNMVDDYYGDVDEDECDEEDGDDWDYWTNRMKEDLEKDGGAK